MRLTLIAFLVCITAAFVVEAPRHLRLTKSAPAQDAVLEKAPPEIRLWYNQNVKMPVTTLSLTHNESEVVLEPLALKDDPKSFRVIVPDSLRTGHYTVAWATAGNDDHVIRGTFSYTVATP